MRAGWKTAQLGNVCSLIARGVAPKYVEEGGVLVLNQKCVRDHVVNYSLGRRHDETAKSVSPNRFVQVGDVLINSTGTGTLGRVAQVRRSPEEPATVDTHVTIVRPKPGEFDLDFFGYALIVLEDQLAASGEGTSGQTELARSVVTKVEISYPTGLDEQRRIVAVLDEAFAAIATATANAEKNLASARELFACTVEEMLERAAGCKPMTLQSAADDSCSLSYGIVQPGDEHAGGLPIVRPTDLQQKYIELGPLKRIDPSLASGYQRTKLRGEELLLCVRGTTGTLSIAAPELAGGNVTRGIVPIRFNPAILLQELGYFLLLSASVQKQIKAATYGTALMQINIRDLKLLKLRVPPLADQAALAERLNATQADVEQLQTNYSAKLDELAALKQALLHRAFTGQLTMAASLAANNKWKTPAFTAQVIALAYRRHLALGTEATFGRVKAQKVLHLCESVGGIDLGRNPIKDAAGPNDFQHMLAAEDWAKANQFFEFVQRPTGNGYSFRKLARFDAIVTEGTAALKPVQDQLERAIGLIAPMKSEEAELLATVHAAWNNLILDGVEPTDVAIIHEARENWHVAKQKFSDGRFHQAIATIRSKGIVPDGSAKRVGGQEALAF